MSEKIQILTIIAISILGLYMFYLREKVESAESKPIDKIFLYIVIIFMYSLTIYEF
jgi:hypothetical protein